MLDKSYYDKADEVIAVYGRKPDSLIPIMQDAWSWHTGLGDSKTRLDASYHMDKEVL